MNITLSIEELNSLLNIISRANVTLTKEETNVLVSIANKSMLEILNLFKDITDSLTK